MPQSKLRRALLAVGGVAVAGLSSLPPGQAQPLTHLSFQAEPTNTSEPASTTTAAPTTTSSPPTTDPLPPVSPPLPLTIVAPPTTRSSRTTAAPKSTTSSSTSTTSTTSASTTSTSSATTTSTTDTTVAAAVEPAKDRGLPGPLLVVLLASLGGIAAIVGTWARRRYGGGG